MAANQKNLNKAVFRFQNKLKHKVSLMKIEKLSVNNTCNYLSGPSSNVSTHTLHIKTIMKMKKPQPIQIYHLKQQKVRDNGSLMHQASLGFNQSAFGFKLKNLDEVDESPH